jgi:hypothetical protein
MNTQLLRACAIAAALVGAVPHIEAQAPAPKTAAGAAPTLTIGEALPMTCEQAWIAGGQKYAPMLATVKTLAKVSLANRNLTFPNTREAGVNAGRGIADDCKADPNALLFAVVDKHVRMIAKSGAR